VDSGYYAAFTGLLARTQALDEVANNLANTNTNGFRAERDYFRNTVAGPHAIESQLNTAVNNFGVLGGNRVDLSQGQMTKTGNPLDVAVEGQGFFSVQTKQGVLYTRDGSFMRSSAGVLMNARGEPILNTQNKPIVVPTGAVTIAADGTVSVDNATVGRIGVFDFPAGTPLVPQGVSSFQAPPDTAKPSTTAALHQGMIESSNQDVVRGTLQLVLVQRQVEMMTKALSVFDNDLDQQASQELPRV
jgi:flagellar basal-body rod protein FlgF